MTTDNGEVVRVREGGRVFEFWSVSPEAVGLTESEFEVLRLMGEGNYGHVELEEWSLARPSLVERRLIWPKMDPFGELEPIVGPPPLELESYAVTPKGRADVLHVVGSFRREVRGWRKYVRPIRWGLIEVATVTTLAAVVVAVLLAVLT